MISMHTDDAMASHVAMYDVELVRVMDPEGGSEPVPELHLQP